MYCYRAIATFSEQVERYLATFGEGRVHVILQEDLRRDPASVIRGLLTFLDVDPAFAPEFPVINVNKRVRSVAFQHLLYNPTRPTRRLLRRMFPFPAARRRLVDAAVGWNVVRTPRQPLSRDLRQRLQAEFAPEVDRLGRLLGRDLASVWQTQPPAREGRRQGRPKDAPKDRRCQAPCRGGPDPQISWTLHGRSGPMT